MTTAELALAVVFLLFRLFMCVEDGICLLTELILRVFSFYLHTHSDLQ